jgi:dTDP-4-dehydrorhamnose reductase
MQKILIIGGSGLVGSTLVKYMKKDFDIHITYNKNPVDFQNIYSTKIDLMKNSTEILNLIKKWKPEIVIHTVAHSSVDLCETDHNVADYLHVKITKDISIICKKINSKLIYFSTDAVFPGELGKKYTEKDIPDPINYYGKTKLRSEQVIMQNHDNYTILRTAVIYGTHTRSRFTDWIKSKLENNEMVDPHVDQFNTPTLVDDLAKVVIKIIQKDVRGLYHATGKTCINRYEFAIQIAKKFGYDIELIKPVTASEKIQKAPRATSTCLDSSKLEKILEFNFLDISHGIKFIYHNQT